MDDYKEQLKIDKDNLDEECINQPVLYDRYASQVPDSVYGMDQAKLDMEVLKADLYKKNIALAIKDGGKKPTDKSLESDILLDSDFQKVQDIYYEAKKKAEKAKAVREAFMQRKEMIRGLIELHNSTYFSRVETKTDKSARESYDNEKLKRRTRGK